ncbi:MAG: TfoX/Sxy family protein [Acidimicrobiales bacterium]
MEIPKPTDDDKAWFRSVVGDLPAAEIKPMFGNLAGFVNGNMFCGLFGPDLGVRLGEEEREELLAIDGAAPFGPPDRPMREYVSLPPSWRLEQTDQVDLWLERACSHTSNMPPKKPKKKATKARKKKS